MSLEAFTGRAQAYTKSRPSYPVEAIGYISEIMPQNTIIADIGAGTGKFTELLAIHNYELYAIEPNADMREQLTIALATFPNVKIIDATAEATTLANQSIDVITCAQALNRVDINMFRTECRRIGRANPLVISLYNYERDKTHSVLRYEKSTTAFYKNPIIREFPNPIYFTRDRWLQYHLSMEGVPQKSDAEHEAYFAQLNEIFDQSNENGVLLLDFVTNVYAERIG
ncbi:MAG: class I SAM-dependent methyltransferase [Defluviitaleaceae bacterium]|nr:class I SAM-dependent methyltransferase [Defluviitaleaceae bacterium]